MKAAVQTLETHPPTEATPPRVAESAADGLPAGVELLARLERITADRGRSGLAARLADLADFVATDMAGFEETFEGLEHHDDRVGRAAGHLLARGGKRLRPMCLMLAARAAGKSTDEIVVDLGVAVELVHSATLLHDDVVDLGDSRRGSATARSIFGNAASIFAGDWLLVEALRRVHRQRIPGLIETLFDTIEEMIQAEAIQLENRGRVASSRDDYFRVVVGKTASVFRWAMTAASAVGGLDDDQRAALEDYGRHIGIAFQLVDDLLDLTGDAAQTGKALFTDLREGKMTYPVILGLEREPSLRLLIESIVTADPESAVSADACRTLVQVLGESEAVRDGLALAREHSARAVACLSALPDSRARRALATVAEAIVDRDL